MAKQCPECSTRVADEAPYCDACGCQFSKNPAMQVTESRWKYLSVFFVVAVIAAFLVLGRSCGAG
jgi:hypothetical protein